MTTNGCRNWRIPRKDVATVPVHSTVELLKACEAAQNHKIKVYDTYGHRWIIGYEVFSNGHRYWTYCRDNSTGVIIPATDINEIVDAIHPVRIKV